MDKKENLVSSYIYCSETCVSFTDESLQKLQNKLKSRFLTLGITGVLSYHNDRFVHYLEGSRQGIKAVIEELAQSTDHTIVKALNFGAIKERIFGKWSMKIFTVTDTDQIIPEYLYFLLTYMKVPILKNKDTRELIIKNLKLIAQISESKDLFERSPQRPS